ncbi:uncharacterized protein A4U43_C07F2750 [Asparagus officinalis]|uniref:C2H2-type domain-containing protein n=1 Tax=Asparagus officinalis TaxID=4686 RepID=A0A5P1EAU8_ASPOF|nr:uncharacterized protein A4U43_C07F2750 [Asparagus officinalis]
MIRTRHSRRSSIALSGGGGVPGTGRDHNRKRVFECQDLPVSNSLPFKRLGVTGRVTRNRGLATVTRAGPKCKAQSPQCSICGHEFATGQALGGHMRRHRADNDGFGHAGQKAIGRRVDLWDLNLPASGNDAEHRDLGLVGLELELGLGLGLGAHYVHKTIPMVDCFR